MNIKLNLNPRPRMKEQYKADGKMMNILADEFQQDIKDKARIAIHNSYRDFPISGGVSMIIDFYTNRDLNIVGLVKNVVDSLNGVVFTDDIRVKSIVSKIHPAKEAAQETITIDILSGRELDSLNCDASKFKRFVVLNVEADSILEDNYLLYPSEINTSEVAGVNEKYDALIVKEVGALYGGDRFEGPVDVSATFNIASEDEGDLDNYAANYLYNFEGSVIEAVHQIKSLHLIKRYVNKDKENIEIEIKEK